MPKYPINQSVRRELMMNKRRELMDQSVSREIRVNG